MAHIDDLIFDARFFAQQVLVGAGQALGQAMATVNSITAFPVPDNMPDISAIDPPKPPDPPELPEYAGQSFMPQGTLPYPPNLSDVGDIKEPKEPGPVPPVKTYLKPNAPAAINPTPTFGQPPPVNTNINIPNAPSLMGQVAAIPVPPISDINLPPPPPSLNLPVYSPGHIYDPGAPPSNLDDMLMEEYLTISPIMQDTLRAQFDSWIDFYYPTLRSGVAAMEAKLDAFLLGGTGLTPTDEDALYNRALDKHGAEAARARDTAYHEAAKLGFTLPVPLALQQAKEIDQGYRDNLARTANDIMVKNAELEQQNIQFALTLRNNASTSHMQAAVSYHSQLVQINGQAVQFAIATVEQIVKVYNLAVDYARVTVQLEEARIHLYETQIKAAMAVIEYYKALIEGEMAKVAIDKARVELYQAQLNAILIEASLYKTEMEGARLRGDMEKLKVELYAEQVKAYASQVAAYSAGWQGYEAAVRGAMADVTASVEVVRAHSAESENYRATIQGRTALIDAKMRKNEGTVRIYSEQVQAYRGINQAVAESVKAQYDSYDATLKVFLAQNQENSEYYRAQIAFYDTARKAMVETVQIMLEEVREANKISLAKAQAVATLAAAIGHDYAATAQASLSGLNTLAGEMKQTRS